MIHVLFHPWSRIFWGPKCRTQDGVPIIRSRSLMHEHDSAAKQIPDSSRRMCRHHAQRYSRQLCGTLLAVVLWVHGSRVLGSLIEDFAGKSRYIFGMKVIVCASCLSSFTGTSIEFRGYSSCHCQTCSNQMSNILPHLHFSNSTLMFMESVKFSAGLCNMLLQVWQERLLPFS